MLLTLLTVQVWLTIQRPGVFYGQCSELCGANHAFMPIVVEAVTPRQVRKGACLSRKYGGGGAEVIGVGMRDSVMKDAQKRSCVMAGSISMLAHHSSS